MLIGTVLHVVSKDQILFELRRVAAELGCTPGRRAFERETGIRESDWLGRHWVRWGEAVAEAGLAANTLQRKFADRDLAAVMAVEVRRLGRYPTVAELKMRARDDPDFPTAKTFGNRGGRAGMVELVREFCASDLDAWGDVLDLLPAAPEVAPPPRVTPEPEVTLGYVYLVRSGRRYKIGLSTDVQRRLLQLNTGMPDAGELVHVINTDDPAGIEAYWHRRFASRRVRPDAEWFDLSPEDVRAFRRRKFQ